MSKKAAIYDPYVDTLGGGERYCLTVAETLLKKGYEVDLFWSGDKDIVSKAEKRFNLDISKINLVPNIFQNEQQFIENTADSESISKISSITIKKPNLYEKISKFIQKIKLTRQYDLIFYISDWSLPFLFSKKNLLHVQVPFNNLNSNKFHLLNYIKMLLITNIICNSKFTSNFANKQFGNKTVVVYPPVDTQKFSPLAPKENIILSVGRFDNILNSKKQDILIECFKKIIIQNPTSSWKLILAGGSIVSDEDNSYLHHLKNISAGFPIEFQVNPSFLEIKSIYEKSKIYWHAAGFGVNQETNPESTEHFGMAPVEAMASGLVPIVVNKGGLSEIVNDNINGYLWNQESELIAKTQILIGAPSILQEKSKLAVIRSKEFSKENFINILDQYI